MYLLSCMAYAAICAHSHTIHSRYERAESEINTFLRTGSLPKTVPTIKDDHAITRIAVKKAG